MRVYISGITSSQQVDFAVRTGVSAIGISIGYGPGLVNPEQAREIFSKVPMFISRVGMFADEKRYHLQEIASLCNLHAFHFVGQETAEACQRYREHIIKDFGINALDIVADYPVAGVVINITPNTVNHRIIIKDGRYLILSGTLAQREWQAAVEKHRPFAVHLRMPDIDERLVRFLTALSI